MRLPAGLAADAAPGRGLAPDVVPRSLAEGYEVQERLVRRLLDDAGGRPVGYTVACTSALVQQARGVDGPFISVLLSHACHASLAALPASSFTVRCT